MYHFILKREKIRNERSSLLEELRERVPEFELLSFREKFSFMYCCHSCTWLCMYVRKV